MLLTIFLIFSFLWVTAIALMGIDESQKVEKRLQSIESKIDTITTLKC